MKYKITFTFNDNQYVANLEQVDNRYTVLPNDHHLRERFGQVMLLEAYGSFAWSNPDPEFYQFALAIALVLEKRLD